jgi:signal transduction histidine kinase
MTRCPIPTNRMLMWISHRDKGSLRMFGRRRRDRSAPAVRRGRFTPVVPSGTTPTAVETPRIALKRKAGDDVHGFLIVDERERACGFDVVAPAEMARLGNPLPVWPGAQLSCAAAVADDRERFAERVNDEVIRRLFGLSLHLQATAQMVDSAISQRLEIAIEALDTTIVEIRRAIFADDVTTVVGICN